MRSAKEAAAKTAIARAAQPFQQELKIIEQRIDGAAAAGFNNVEIIFEGNAFDEHSIEQFKQVLLDADYQVKITDRKKLGHQTGWQFNIIW